MKKWALWGLFYAMVVGFFVTAAWIGSGAVTVMAQRIPAEREQTVVIDPGHGGEDGGAVSCTGVMEKQINLEIALRLNDLLHLLGYRTVMTRTEDISIHKTGNTIAQRKVSDLKERVRIVEETPSALLVSIHQNLFSDGRYSGAQVFYAPAGSSRELARMVQDTFISTVNPVSHRQIKPASGIYLMEHIGCTAILVECGFLSNQAEEENLRTPKYQQNISCVIGTAVANFLDGQT